MAPEQQVGVGVTYQLDEPFLDAKSRCAPRRRQREAAHTQFVASLFRFGFRHADAGQLGRGVDDRRHHGVVGSRFACCMLGSHQALFHGLVRQQRRPRDVAYRVDMRHRRLHVVVDDRDVAPLVDFDAQSLEPQVTTVGTPAHRHQDAVDGQLLALAVRPCQDYFAALLAWLLRLDLGAGLDDDAALLQRLAELFGSVSIGARRDLLEQLHYRHAAAKRLVDVGELEPDGSCPDHQEALRHAVTDGQGAGGINDPVTVEFEAGDDYRARAGGDDERLGRVLLLPYRDRVGVDERRCAREQRYFVALEQHADAASHFLDDALLEAL